MGINLFKHKVMSFTIGSFYGIGGGLMAVHLGTIDPALFKFPYFQYLANWYWEVWKSTACNLCHSHHCSHGSPKVLRWVYELWFFTTSITGLRMVVFSLALMVVVIFKRDNF